MNFRGFGGASQSQNDGGIIGEISPGKIYFLACFVMPEFSLAHHEGFLPIITDKALNISVIGKRIVLFTFASSIHTRGFLRNCYLVEERALGS